MPKTSLPRSLRKFIRREKARIRRQISDPKEAEQKVRDLAERFFISRKREKKHTAAEGIRPDPLQKV